jgi:sugar lactone lactonase YvrE
MKRLLIITALFCAATAVVSAQGYTIKTFAGELPPTTAPTRPNNIFLALPDSVLSDVGGNVYMTDTNSHKVWKIDAAGKVTLVIGTGATGTPANGKAANTQPINQPAGLAVDAKGNLYVSDRGSHRIFQIDSAGVVTKIAGVGSGRFTGDGRPANFAELNSPRGMTVGPDGNLYVADTSNQRIRKIDLTSGVILTVAGSSTSAGFAGDGGKAVLARLSAPEGVAFDPDGNMLIADTGNNRIRQVDSHGIIATIAGRDLTNKEKGLDDSGQPVKNPAGSGNLKAAAAPFPASCPKPKPGVTDPCAAVGDGKDPLQALLAAPSGIIVDTAGNIFFSDRNNHRIREINAATGAIQTVVGTGSSGNGGDGNLGQRATVNNPNGLSFDASAVLYFTDRSNNRVRKFDTTAGIVGTVAGANPFNGDQAALQTLFSTPTGIVADALGNVYVADSGNNRVRKIDKSGQVTTIAGGGNDSKNEGIEATSAALNNPAGIVVDPSGTEIYVVDTGNNRIRRITTGLITTVAGGGAFSADGLPATSVKLNLNSSASGNSRKFPSVALDGKGNVFFTEPGNSVVRKLQADGTLVTVAGVYGTSGAEGDGGPANLALFNNPTAIAVDADGNIYVSDTGNHTVRVITGGVILPLAGETGASSNDGESATSPAYTYRWRLPMGLALDAAGNLYVADSGNNKVDQVKLSTLIATRIGGNNSNGNGEFAFNFAGEDTSTVGNEQLSYPTGIAVDSKGVVYFTDAANNLIRMLVPTSK